MNNNIPWQSKIVLFLFTIAYTWIIAVILSSMLGYHDYLFDPDNDYKDIQLWLLALHYPLSHYSFKLLGIFIVWLDKIQRHRAYNKEYPLSEQGKIEVQQAWTDMRHKTKKIYKSFPLSPSPLIMNDIAKQLNPQATTYFDLSIADRKRAMDIWRQQGNATDILKHIRR